MEDRFKRLWDMIIDHMIATEDECCLVTSINGWNLETLASILYSRTGYRSLEQYEEYFKELN